MSVPEEVLSTMPQLTDMSGNDYKMEALQRAAKERQDIVSKYTKGVDSEGEEDHWEDSAFKVYKITDRYGFLHKEELSEIPSLEEEKRKLTEVKRQYKWVKMIQKWKAYEGTEKLRSRVCKGIPLNMRGDAWKLMLNVAGLMAKDENVYEEMKKRSEIHSPDIKQIDMDVNRTYRNHIMFRKRYSIKQQQLFHVLAAYSMYNTEVGYCQGMSQIAALLLMYMSEEEAFWGLHSLLYGKKHRMHGFFIPGFPKLIRFQDHHDKILKKFIPRLKKHLDKNEIFASLYTMKWFFQCFLDRSPFPLTLRLWDMYVLEGEKILVAMSYTTLKMHKTTMKKMEMDEIVSFLQERLAENFGTNDDAVVEQLKLNMTELKRAKMDLPPSPGENEAAKLPFGVAVKPSFEHETGIRAPTEKSGTNSSSKASSQDKRRVGNGGKGSEVNGSIPVTSDEVQSSGDTRGFSSPSDARTTSDENDKRRKKSSGGRRSEEKRVPAIGKAPKDSKSSFKKGSGKKDKTKSNKEKARSERKSQHEEEKRKSFTPLEDEVFLSTGDNKASSHNRTSPNSNHNEAQKKSNGHNSNLSHYTREGISPTAQQSQIHSPSSVIYVSSVESSQLHESQENKLHHPNTHDNEKLKLVWKTPNQTKPIPPSHRFLTSRQETSSSSPVSPQDSAWSDEAGSRVPATGLNTSAVGTTVTRDAVRAQRKPRNEESSKHESRTKSRRNEDQHPDVSSNTRKAMQGYGKKASKNKKFTFDPARPYSVYDNVADAAFTESDDELVVDPKTPLAVTSPASERDNESVYETKMEESLENLRELAAGLSRTPSPRSQRPRRHSPRKQLSPLVGYQSFDPISEVGEGKKRSNRPKSMEIVDVGDDVGEMELSPLDHVARSLSKSAEILEKNKKKPTSTSSAFRKAVEGAGITQLPKRPSSTLLNTVLAQNRSDNDDAGSHFSYSWQVPEQNNHPVSSVTSPQYVNPSTANSFSPQPEQDAMKQKNPVRWLESDLDHPYSPTYNYPLQRKADMETQPIAVTFSRREHNENNNSRSGNRRQQIAPLTSQLHGRGGAGAGLTRHPGHAPSSGHQHGHGRKSSLTYYSRHGVSDLRRDDAMPDAYQRMEVTRYDENSRSKSQPLPGSVPNETRWQSASSGEAFVDIAQCSPDHSPLLEHNRAPDSARSVTIGHPRSSQHSRAAAHPTGRRHREPEVASPPYAAATSRYRQYVVPDTDAEAESLTLSNSSWSRTKRKNSSSIAIQTEQSTYLPNASFI